MHIVRFAPHVHQDQAGAELGRAGCDLGVTTECVYVVDEDGPPLQRGVGHFRLGRIDGNGDRVLSRKGV